MFTINLLGTEQSERQFTVCRQYIFGTDIDARTDTRSMTAVVASVLQIDEIHNLVIVFVKLVFYRIVTSRVYRYIMTTVEGERLVLVLCMHIVAPMDKAQIENGCTDGKILIYFVYTTQVDGKTDTAYTGTIHIYARYTFERTCTGLVLLDSGCIC